MLSGADEYILRTSIAKNWGTNVLRSRRDLSNCSETWACVESPLDALVYIHIDPCFPKIQWLLIPSHSDARTTRDMTRVSVATEWTRCMLARKHEKTTDVQKHFLFKQEKTYVFVKVKRRARYRSAREIRRTAKGYGRQRKGLCTKKMRPSLALRRGAARQRGSAQRAETQASGRPRTAREKERREMSWSNEIAIFRSGGCFARDDLPGTPRYSCEQDAAELFSAFKQDARPSFCESANANL